MLLFGREGNNDCIMYMSMRATGTRTLKKYKTQEKCTEEELYTLKGERGWDRERGDGIGRALAV